MKSLPGAARRFLAAVGIGLGVAAGALTAQAQTVIDHLPYSINSPGTYVLNSDLNSSQANVALILVSASNVTIDFRGHYIAGAVGNTSQTTVGISVYEISNLTVKNGTIAYCSTGIILTGNGQANTNSVGSRIENMRMTYCYHNGIYVSYCLACRIANCQVSQTGFGGASDAVGVSIVGPGTTISGCIISTVTATNSFGISADTGSFVRRNTVSNAKVGVYGGKYQDNLTANCTTPYGSGTDAGGNN